MYCLVVDSGRQGVALMLCLINFLKRERSYSIYDIGINLLLCHIILYKSLYVVPNSVYKCISCVLDLLFKEARVY